jgi:hypothetical protein
VIALTRTAISRGASLPWFHEKDISWVAVLILGALGLLAIVGGVALILWVKRLFSLRILVCPSGLVEVQRGQILSCRWEDIAQVEETILHEHLPLKHGLKYVAPVGKSRSYVVRRRDGKEFVFDGNRVKGLGRLAKLLRQEAETRAIPWMIKEESN